MPEFKIHIQIIDSFLINTPKEPPEASGTVDEQTKKISDTFINSRNIHTYTQT